MWTLGGLIATLRGTTPTCKSSTFFVFIRAPSLRSVFAKGQLCLEPPRGSGAGIKSLWDVFRVAGILGGVYRVGLG